MKRKICILATSRATYGYKKRIIKLINEAPDLELQLIVTGMHPLKEYGHSINEIFEDRVPIATQIDMMIGGGTTSAYAKSLGVEMQGLVQAFDILKPDVVLVTGDRGEMFIACATAAYMNIPVAHIQSGDVSGHIDGAARHAMTKLSHIHLPACEDSAVRVEKMGEESWRIYNVGAPQLDEIVQGKKLSINELNKYFDIDFNEKILLILQHPVLVENEKAAFQMEETLDAVKKTGLNSILIYPNIDAGNEQIINVIESYSHSSKIKIRRNMERHIFISLLATVSVLVGNSSCGILEAPSLKLPAINIGNRQRGRMQASNVINCGYNRKEIFEAINIALYDQNFLKDLNKCVNPYGDGYSSERIVDILRKIEINETLLDKQITY
jgi:UDP-N-acetylglucosamine 2-epimerase (non-hydrolysing)/GDP/UDP-N,N'-diacetylbacillosamine 2-epimerase (hydrolysing)